MVDDDDTKDAAAHDSGAAVGKASGDPETDETVAQFFQRCGYSPLKEQRGGTHRLATVKAKAEKHLECIGKTWNDLDVAAQIKLTFIIVNHLDDHVRDYHTQQVPKLVAQSIVDAVSNNKSSVFDRLEAFVRKGGDEAVDNAGAMKALEYFLKDKGWGDPDKATTIFTHPDEFRQVSPLIRFQTETSTVCYMVASANLVYYSKCKQETQAVHSGHILNVNRFMRNEFQAHQMFKNIFLGHGGSCEEFLRFGLQPSNAGKDLFVKMPLRHEMRPSTAFDITKFAIQDYGALLIEDFKIIKAFSEKGLLEYDCNNYDLTEMQQSTNRHALLVIGVRQTVSEDVKGGVEFLLQNSSADKPFLTVGYDLLRAMGVSRFLALHAGLNIGATAYPVDEPTRAIISGNSPRSMPSGGFHTAASPGWSDSASSFRSARLFA